MVGLFSNQFKIDRERYLLAAINLAASCGELYFARCCALKRTGIFASESKVMCLFSLRWPNTVLARAFADAN